MKDTDCTAFLQWALPRLELRWPGFRKVRTQVCKRLRVRLRNLGLESYSAYRDRLEADPSEWRTVDECCHITISRFFRDRRIFEVMREHVLPDIAARAKQEACDAKVWSAGCASGEEPYTLRMLWDLGIASMYPGIQLSIVASDIDEAVLTRAREGCFESSSLRETPQALVEQAFNRVDARFCIKPEFREGIEFIEQDLRAEMPPYSFHLVLCRYVAFTYFSAALQRKVLTGILERLRPEGYLVIGSHERLPGNVPELVPAFGLPQLFQKRAVAKESIG